MALINRRIVALASRPDDLRGNLRGKQSIEFVEKRAGRC
jgi:hypothetical protein